MGDDEQLFSLTNSLSPKQPIKIRKKEERSASAERRKRCRFFDIKGVIFTSTGCKSCQLFVGFHPSAHHALRSHSSIW